MFAKEQCIKGTAVFFAEVFQQITLFPSNATSEKLAPRSRSFRAIFHVSGRFGKFSDAFGPVRMHSDVIGWNRMHFGALESVSTLLLIFSFFRIFRRILAIFGQFLVLGAYFY